jgi:bifunctional N-acetylglucosamine-1-phosphate-uridyltransferase/glucosamine-1-phosphate-acetyltransferase GlmU-like protein
MEQTLLEIKGEVTVHPIPEHKLGPVHAVLQICEALDSGEAVIVNYSDFFCLWDYGEFLFDLQKRELEGCVPSYRGFHPHSGGTTNYAYLRERDGELLEIREKQPFTTEKTEEFASTGTYYFKTVGLMRTYFEKLISENISVNGEFYASSAFDLMAKDGLKVGVYEVSHFMQWGTPEDFEEYVFWSDAFRMLSASGRSDGAIAGAGNLVVLASGRGSRFSDVGYQVPKPFLSVSGDSMLNQVLKVGEPSAKRAVSVTSDLLNYTELLSDVKIVSFNEVSGGQAESASNLLEELKDWEDSTFTVLPSDTLFSDSSSSLRNIVDELSGEAFLVVWASNASPYALKNPQSFGWISSVANDIETFIKAPPASEGAKVISGAFTFSSSKDFSVLFDALRDKKLMVNGEFYLDSMISIAQEMGYQVRIFEPEFCLSLGTPYEFETFRYWQTAFDQWESHPYELEEDQFVRPENIQRLRASLQATKHLPSEWVSS